MGEQISSNINIFLNIFLEQVRGIEPPSSAWQALILTVELYLHKVPGRRLELLTRRASTYRSTN